MKTSELTSLEEMYQKAYFELVSHMKRGIKDRRSRGLHWGPLPLGYRRCDVSCPKDHPTHPYCHPEQILTGYIVEAFWRSASGHHTLKAISEWLNDQEFRTGGGNAFTVRAVRAMLTNPFYAGLVLDPDAVLGVRPGIHRAVIDEELFNTVQERIR